MSHIDSFPGGKQHPLVRVLRSGLAAVKRAARQAPDLDTLLELGELYGLLLHANPTGIYADDQLVRLCVRRFVSDLSSAPQPKSRLTLHVISDARAYGGHTRLMERLASFDEERPELLLTRSTYGTYTESVRHLFSRITQIGHDQEAGSVHAIAKYCATFQHVVAHTTEFDFRTAVGLTAARRAASTTVNFVNHADHHFSFGRQDTDCVLQVSRIGINACNRHVPKVRSSFLGIPLDGTAADLREPSSGHAFRVLTGGASWKFRPMLGLSVVPGLHLFLQAVPDATLTVVGVNHLRDRWWWPLKMRYWKRVILKPSLPYADYLQCLAECSIVLDSYPISGGTAFAESLWGGSWVFALESPLGGGSPTDLLRQKTLQSLKPELLGAMEYKDQLEKCKRLLTTVHGPDAVKGRYRAALAGAAIEAPESLQAPVHAQFLADAWLAKGSITLPAAVFGLRAAPCRRILARYGLREFNSLTWVSRLRWLAWLFRSSYTALRRHPERA